MPVPALYHDTFLIHKLAPFFVQDLLCPFSSCYQSLNPANSWTVFKLHGKFPSLPSLPLCMQWVLLMNSNIKAKLLNILVKSGAGKLIPYISTWRTTTERCIRSDGRIGKVLNSNSSLFLISYGIWSLWIPPMLLSHLSFRNGRKAWAHHLSQDLELVTALQSHDPDLFHKRVPEWRLEGLK